MNTTKADLTKEIEQLVNARNLRCRQVEAMTTILKHGTAGHGRECTCVACEALRASDRVFMRAIFG
jgi:hypothetical protein